MLVIVLNDFCPLINGRCNSNCVFIEQKPGVFGLVNHCSLAETVKLSENRPNVEILIELKKLVSKF